MADKALIAIHGAPQDPANVAQERHDAAAAGCAFEIALPHGILVRGTTTQFGELIARGYWVRVYRDTNLLRVGRYSIDLDGPLPTVPGELEVPQAKASTWPHHLIQLIAPPIPDWINQIQSAGATIITGIPNCGLAVSATPGQVEQIGTMAFHAWHGPFKPAYRLAQSLENAGAVVRDLVVLAYPATSADEVKGHIESLGGTVSSRGELKGFARLVATLNAQQLNALATFPPVFRLEYVDPEIVLIDESSCQIVAGGAPAGMQAPGYNVKTLFGVDGTGVSIAIVDTGVDSHHPDFVTLAGVSRFTSEVKLDPAIASLTDCLGHGTAVAGIAAGNALTVTSPDRDSQNFALGQGVAPEASLINLKAYHDVGAPLSPPYTAATGTPPVSVPPSGDWANIAHDKGAQIMNNSWETKTNVYDDVSRKLDQAVREHQLTVVCGAGNNPPGGPAAPVKQPGIAKNVITVGASGSYRRNSGVFDHTLVIDTMWPLSRSGPTPIGRIVPTLVAPGMNIISTLAKCGAEFVEGTTHHPDHALGGTLLNPGASTCVGGAAVGGKSGTSYAAPHVAGACALLIESWQQRTAGRLPSPALLKAWLVNGATNLGTAANPFIPNNDSGWGRINLDATLRSDGGQKLFVDQAFVFIDTNAIYERRVTAVNPAKPLRVTLVWTDPFDPDSLGRLLHNLELEVVEEGTGQRFFGNVNFANGFSNPWTPASVHDATNNVECVYLQNPNGIYTVRVTLNDTVAVSEPADFALVIENVEEITPSPVNVALLLDLSSSMSGSGYDEPARRAANGFIGCLRAGDVGAVVTFADAAAVDYPLTPINEPARIAARATVDGLAFGGCTYTGDGIQLAKQQLAAGTAPRSGIVLLSDGYDNQGCQPSPARPTALAAAAAGAAVPIYTCALGPASDQVTMRDLAVTTGGRYYYSPGESELQEIYGYLSADLSGDDVAELDVEFASHKEVPVAIDASVTSVTFQVTWDNLTLEWVAKTIRRGKIQIDLFTPQGHRVDLSLCHYRVDVRPGCLTVGIDQPPAGLWTVAIRTLLAKHTRCTVAAYVRSPHVFEVEAPAQVQAGKPITIKARGFVAPAKGQTTVRARVSRPAASLAALQKKYAKLLHKQSVSSLMSNDNIPANVAKLIGLNRAMMKQGKKGFFNPLTSSLGLTLHRPTNTFVGKRLTPVPGTYNFIVTGRVQGPAGTTPIVRKKMVSVLVVP